jgi:hypothetical protein
VWASFLLQIRRPVQVKGDGRLSFVAVCVDNEAWAAAVPSKEPLLSKASGARLTRKRREYSSGGHQQLGSISKQGNRFVRMLLVEAAQVWAWLSRYWSGWRSALAIVNPETVIAWHRQGFRLYWRWKSRHRLGRPSVSREVIDLIVKISVANPRGDAPRIHGELLKLGFELSQATVAKYMVRRRKPPSQT